MRVFYEKFDYASFLHDYRNMNESRTVIPKCFELNLLAAVGDAFNVVLPHTQAKVVP
jgi:hypothetical protein